MTNPLLFLLMTLSTLLQLQPTNSFIFGERLGPLRVATFNVRHFGRGYLDDKPTSVSHLVRILSRYDLVLVQETRDSTGTALDELKDKLNSASGEAWNYIASDELGRNNAYLEQYVFLYKVKSATFVTAYQVNDTARDLYAREPFCVEFAYTSTSRTHSVTSAHRETVVFLAIHTPPTTTRQELDKLPDTIRSVAAIFPHSAGVIAMGDMNADCRYLAGKWRNSMEIFNGEDFTSLVADTEDSATRGSSDCAYDRVVLYGKRLEVTEVKVWNFQSWLHLDEAEAMDVSDHFPVEFLLH